MKYLPIFSLFLIAIFMNSCSSDAPESEESDPLAVSWELIRNYDQGGHLAQFVLTNTGATALEEDWEIYWNMAPREVDQKSISAPVEIEWINGDYYVMKPSPGFRLAPGERLEIDYEGDAWMIKESDAPLGVFMVAIREDGEEVVTPINDYEILPFTRPEQISRSKADDEPIPTPEYLYDQFAALSDLPSEDIPLIVPQPRNILKGEGTFVLRGGMPIQAFEGAGSDVDLLTQALKKVLTPQQTVATNTPSNMIRLVYKEQSIPGSYTLAVSREEGIQITGDNDGVFNGIQSLLALIPAENLGSANETIEIPEVTLSDSPAFQYRGFFLDISRNFNSLESVKRILDVMAFYKLNKFHIHLTEDEGWRIAIEELPELTAYGSKRGFSRDEQDFLNPAYGSGADPSEESGYGSGFYTRDEFIEMIRYAKARHIDVIPEFNVPGHSRAAIKSMEYRYRKYMDQGNEEEAEKYRLLDPQDQSEYRSAQWYTDNTICVCRESAFRFVTTVLDDIIEMYEEAGYPLEMMHMGGDEVPLGVWTASPICTEFMKELPEIENPKNLQQYFFNRVNNYLANKNIRTSGWEEIAQNFAMDGSWSVNDEFAGGQVVPYVWNSIWGAEDLGYQMANAGYPVVLCPVSNFYFDLAYNKDPREAGLYWAGFVDTQDAFDFVPYDMFQSIKVTSMGQAYTASDFEGKERLNPSAKSNILGIQAQLWSETVKGEAMAEYYILPKLMGLSERAWYGSPDWATLPAEQREVAKNEAWNIFANTLGKRELPRLDKMNSGYNYRLPPPGAKVINGKVEANVAFPGLEVRFTTDGSEPSAESERYESPLEVGNSTVKMVTVDAQGRTSFTTTIVLK